MNIKNIIISQLPFLLVSLVMLGMFTNDTQGVLNISAALLFLYTIYVIIKNKIHIKDDIINLVRGKKVFFYSTYGVCLVSCFLLTPALL